MAVSDVGETLEQDLEQERQRADRLEAEVAQIQVNLSGESAARANLEQERSQLAEDLEQERQRADRSEAELAQVKGELSESSARAEDLEREHAQLAQNLAKANVKAQAYAEQVTRYEAAEKARVRAARDSYLDDLQARAVAAQSPIPVDDLRKVSAAFDRGDEETARLIGGVLLERSEALSAKRPSAKGATSPLMEAGDPEKVFGHDPDPERGRKALLAEAGFEDDKPRRSGRNWS